MNESKLVTVSDHARKLVKEMPVVRDRVECAIIGVSMNEILSI